MTSGPAVPPFGTVNSVPGNVRGPVVQAHTVTGGIHHHSPARPRVELPYRAGVAPPRAASFQDRDVLSLAGDDGNRTSVLSGLGGVGKTQLALHFAEQLWTAGELDLMVWITAGSREAIMSSYARLAEDLTGIEDADPEQGAQRLLAWFAGTTSRWLVVLDDVRSPSDVRGLWPAVTPTGRVVMTTRRRDAALRGYGRQQIEVGEFTAEESRAYLRDTLADREHLLDGAAGLASELGHLPLALAQASAYLADRDLSCAAYRRRLADRQRSLASLVPDDEGLPDDHRITMAATWSLSVEQANRLAPAGLARPLLEMTSLLDPNGIPLSVLTGQAVIESLGAVTAEDAQDALGCLHRLSLITLHSRSTHREVRVHSLVQRVTRDSLSQDRAAMWCSVVADALLQAWPGDDRDAVLGQVLRANTNALAASGGEHLWKPQGHQVLFRAGISLGESGLFAAAGDYFERLKAIAASHSHPDAADMLAIRNNVAYWRAEAGDPSSAVTAFETLVADYIQVLGPDDPNTLITRHNLAVWRCEAGDVTGAKLEFEALLADHLRILGADHPYTLTSRCYLAALCGRAGDSSGAVTAFETLLADYLRLSGGDDPDTLNTRQNLAFWRGEAGDPAGALGEFETLVADYLRVLGADHPATLRTRGQLALWQGKTGDAAGAVAAFETLLADRVRVLGTDHPYALNARANLAFWRQQAEGPAGAREAFETLLAEQVRVLGADHPDTAATRSHLGQ